MSVPETTVRLATTDDLVYVMSLMRANRESVGGLPAPAVTERIERRTLLLVLVNDDPVGYILYDARNGIVRVPQACIQYDARRRKYAEAVRRRPRFRCPKCKRDDGLWAEVEATAWEGLDEYLNANGDHDVDSVDWRNATRTGSGGCSECQWEGSLTALEKLGWTANHSLPFYRANFRSGWWRDGPLLDVT